MNARLAFGPALLAALLVSGSAAGEGPGRPAPGLRIVSSAGSGPDLAATLDSTLPNWPRGDVIFTVTVRNIGDSACQRSVCLVLIKNAHAPRETMRRVKKSVRALDAGDQFAFSFTVKLGLGVYEIEALADRGNKISEPDEKNNEARLTISGR